MSDLWIPAESDLALTLREPRLLVPGNKPVGPVRIDWSNPLTDGLHSFYAPEFGVDLATGRVPTINGDPGHVGDHDGLAWDLVSGSSHYIDLGAFPTISAFTTGVIAKALSGNAFYCCSRSGSTANGIDLLVNSSATGVSNRIGTTTTNSSTPIWTLDIEEYQHITAGWTTGSKHSLYIRGDLVNQSASTVGGSITHTQNMRLSSRGTLYLSQRLKLFYFFTRELSADEIARFVRNPMQILRSANDVPSRISMPEGGESPLAANDPAAQSDADTAAISQTHGNLAASDAEGAGDADTAAASQDHALAGADIEAGADADTGAVSQAGTLAAEDAEAQADADTAAASQDHQLAGADIEAAADADTGAAGQAGTLAADDAQAVSDADTAAASQDHQLAGADIEAQADPDTGAAQQAGVLTADPAEAQADVDTAAATQDHDLAGADIEAAADADTGAVDGSATTAADDIEARADADTAAVTVIHKPVAADAEGQAAMDAAAAGQEHQLGADDAEARGDIPAGGLLLDGVGVVFSPQLLDVTLRTYLIDPHNPTGAPR